MKSLASTLAVIGIVLVVPAFFLNYVAHDFTIPGPDEVDRLDGVFSVVFMAGGAFIVAALFTTRPAPLGRKGRWLLGVEAVMVVLALIWSAAVIVDPLAIVDSKNPLFLAGDASWPLHQVFMLVVGIAAVRGGSWPSPARYALFGPVAGVAVAISSMVVGVDILVAVGLGGGWAIAASGVLLAERDPAPTRDAAPPETTRAPAF
jgi:hypothetical protein